MSKLKSAEYPLSPPEAKALLKMELYLLLALANAELTPHGVERLVEPGRSALAVTPVEIEVFIEAEICVTGRVTSRPLRF